MKTNKLIQFWSILLVFLTMLGVGETWGGTYSKITSLSALTTGNYVIVGQKGSSSWGRFTYGSMSSGRVTYTEHYDSSLPSSITTTAANEIWALTVSGTGDSRTVTIYNSGQKVYLKSNGSSSSWESSSSTSYTVTYSSGFQFYVSTDDYLGVNSSANYWRDYGSSNLYSTYCITLYKEVTDPYTVTFNKQGGTFDDSSFDADNTLTEASAGAGVTLPAVSPSSACASEGWKFYGWKETSAVTSSTTTAPTIVGKAGDTYYPTSDITLHAVFTQGEYSKVTSITSGAKYLIVTNYSSKNYIMTDSYSLSGSDGQMAGEQIDETSSGKYHAADIDIKWCYTIEDGYESGKYYIRDVVHSSSANYLDMAYQNWYGKGEDNSDEWELTQSSGDWTLKNEYHPKYMGFDGTNKVFKRADAATTTFYLYKAGTINYYSTPSCCEYEVSVSESGSSHITSMAFSESSVPTCGDASSRTITITVTPSSGYSLFGTTKPVFTKTSGTVTATIGSVTDNGNGTFSYECTFNSNDNGAGTFAISPGQFINYRTLCCTKYNITLASSGSKTGGSFEVDPAKACEGTEITLMADADAGYEFSAWTITNDDDDDDDVTTTVLGSGNEDEDAVEFDMPAYNITVDAAFACTEPTISAQPSDASYTQGDVAEELSVTASAGTGSLDYQWQSSSDNSSWDDIDDETSSTYTPPTTSTGTMYYRVVVTNHECSESVESDAATVVVSPPSVCKTPTFSVSAGTYSSAQSVELSCGTDGATIRYTTNGDDPTESSSVYSSAISVSVNTTIKAKAFKADMTPSSIASATYNIRCAAPTFSLDEDIYVGSQSLTMSSATDGATIRYTTDESEPTGSSSLYSSALTVGTSTTYKAKAYKDGMTESEESDIYIMIQCAEPTFNVSAGTYNANQSVSISTTYGTTIYYTLDGNDPTTKSSTYSSAITIDATKTLKAIAVKDGCENSEVASATYTLKCATPTFSPIAGTYTGAQSVSMSCATTGSAIHYTTNGTDPTGSSTTYSSAISVGTNQTVKAIATKSGWSDSEVASAAYTIKYNVAVASVDNVTISATTPSVAEGSSLAAACGSTVSLSYSGVASGKTWGGWNVYKTGDASTTVTVTSNQFTMPAYNVTVSAIIYGDAIAWCDPDVEVTGDVHLTSTKDVPVRYSPSGSDNLITISSSDMGSATTMEVAYLNADAADVEVDKDDSPFRFYKADGSATTEAIDLDYEWSTSHPIRYTPSAYGVTNNYKLQLTFKRGDKVLKTIKKAIYGRGLPEEFVIAVKKGGQWVALPSNLASTSAQPSIIPQVITVNDIETPTAATYAPTTTVYKAMSSGNAAHISTLRFTTTGSNYLQVSGSDYYNMWLSTTNSANIQDWQLKSSDFNSYELTIPSNNATKKMGIYSSTYMGYHGSPNNANIYLLPITNKYSEIAATVSEWGEHGVIVQPSTPSDLLGVASATMNIDDASPSAATTSAVNAAIGTAKRVKVDGGALTVGAVANDGKLLYIHWKNSGGSEIGVSQIQIPVVVAESNDMKTLIGAKETWAKKEVHVLPGVTLTANAGSFGGSAVTVPTMHIYPGATLSISTGTLTATTLRLHNGWTRAGTKKYDVARVYIADDAALTKTTASMDYDIYELTDGQHFYPLAVPFPVAVSAIDYADSWLAGYSSYGMDGQYVIKEYNGARRAEKGPDQANNWTPLAEGATLSPGKGYIMAAVPVYGEAIIRIPLTFDNAWTADGELGTVSAVTKNVVAVTAYEGSATAGDKKVNKGWNLLGVPFMSCYGTSAGMYDEDNVDDPASIIQGKFNFEDGTWDGEDKVRYVNVPVHDFSEYIQTDITDAGSVLRPGWCFFVQIETSGNLKFLTAAQATSSSLPIYAPKRGMKADMPTVETGIILSNGEKSDKTTFLVSDKYNGAEYEINADLEKMFGNGYTLATYSLSGATRLAYNAMSNADASNLIPIGYRAPADGEYTFSINPRYAQSGAFERVDLIDYETGAITNLLNYSYTFSTARTQDDSRFAINVVKQKETPTDIENIQGDNVQGTNVRKLLIDGKVYIIRSGQMYDATGKQVKGGAQ